MEIEAYRLTRRLPARREQEFADKFLLLTLSRWLAMDFVDSDWWLFRGWDPII